MLEIFSGLIPLLEESQGDDRVTRHTLYHLAWMHLLYFHFFIFYFFSYKIYIPHGLDALIKFSFLYFTFYLKKIYIPLGLDAIVIFSFLYFHFFYQKNIYTTWPWCPCYIFTFSFKKIYHLAWMHLLYFHFFI